MALIIYFLAVFLILLLITVFPQILFFSHSKSSFFFSAEYPRLIFSVWDASSRYFLFTSGFALEYTSVVVTDACPRRSLMYTRFTPFSRRCIAFECRRQCADMAGGYIETASILALSKYLRTI